MHRKANAKKRSWMVVDGSIILQPRRKWTVPLIHQSHLGFFGCHARAPRYLCRWAHLFHNPIHTLFTPCSWCWLSQISCAAQSCQSNQSMYRIKPVYLWDGKSEEFDTTEGSSRFAGSQWNANTLFARGQQKASSNILKAAWKSKRFQLDMLVHEKIALIFYTVVMHRVLGTSPPDV